mmetsp:Transcript_2130/g.4048  ORF Transcript_2130/g.4048 Transcript_2130/m.4048 type:complete len:214 (+) Transcript_2130:656-1297(+)
MHGRLQRVGHVSVSPERLHRVAMKSAVPCQRQRRLHVARNALVHVRRTAPVSAPQRTHSLLHRLQRRAAQDDALEHPRRRPPISHGCVGVLGDAHHVTHEAQQLRVPGEHRHHGGQADHAVDLGVVRAAVGPGLALDKDVAQEAARGGVQVAVVLGVGEVRGVGARVVSRAEAPAPHQRRQQHARLLPVRSARSGGVAVERAGGRFVEGWGLG